MSHDEQARSTRRISRESGRFVRSTPGSRSLERGLQLLRAFRIGTAALTNAELAERTGLARPTVSRLTRSLVEYGFLQYDIALQAYRLNAVTLSLGLAYRQQSPVLEAAAVLLAKAAREEQLNVGLAVADLHEMVFVDFARGTSRGIRRAVEPGMRLPVESTSTGRAWLASLPADECENALASLAPRHGAAWPAVRKLIDSARAEVATQGFCTGRWVPGMVGLSAPVVCRQLPGCVVSFAIPLTDDSPSELIERHGVALLRLAAALGNAGE
ncbi:IclR family transcriptional regulator [Cupriavidus sp. NPDC089707]|uniref:IclR family transcriptional regulator n=1 Tax=Cupriavidus sp. NPDC089707 TaxID=3363963 RepID=UPI00382F22E8